MKRLAVDVSVQRNIRWCGITLSTHLCDFISCSLEGEKYTYQLLESWKVGRIRTLFFEKNLNSYKSKSVSPLFSPT